MWFDLIVFGGFWFWALIIAFIIAEISCVHYVSPFAGGFVLLLTSAILLLFGQLKVALVYCFNRPGQSAGIIVAYLVVGVLFSAFKWYRYVKAKTKAFNILKSETLEKHGVKTFGELPVEDLSRQGTWDKRDPRDWLNNHFDSCKMQCDPGQNKDRITTWILYWVFAMFWDIFETITIRLIDNIFESVKSMFSGITKRLFRGLEADMS